MKIPAVRRCCFSTAIIAALALVSFSANAQPITGSISFGGGSFMNGTVSNATAYTGFFLPGAVGMPDSGAATGSFGTVPNGTQGSFNLFTFAPFAGPQLLWSFSIGDVTYSFTADTLTENKNIIQVTLQGSGFLSITGYADTPATWSYVNTSNPGNSMFSFEAMMTATPEPSPLSILSAAGFIPCACQVVNRRKACRRL